MTGIRNGSRRLKLKSFVAIAATIIGFTACAGKKTAGPPPSVTPVLPNVQVFRETPERLWTALTNVVQYRMLLPLEVNDAAKGQFATKLIQDDNEPFKFRLTGKVEKTAEGLAVTLYKDSQVWTKTEWKAEPSDFKLEKEIFEAVKKELSKR